jgi:ATP-dependent helicase/nuclease subunit B
MVRLVDVPVAEDLLGRAVGEALAGSLRELAVVFPSKRAVHHFAKNLAEAVGGPCIPPALFSGDALLSHLAGIVEEEPLAEADKALLLREAVLACGSEGHLAELAGDFAAFFPWGAEWSRAIDELDRELVSDDALGRLAGLEAFESLGPWARAFYEQLPRIRRAYHRALEARGRSSRGALILRALEGLRNGNAELPPRVLFVGFFALTRGERTLLSALGEGREVTLLRHHDGRPWKAFREMEEALSPGHAPQRTRAPLPPVRLHCAPSVHGEVLAAGEVLREKGLDLGRTAVVLPDPATLLPLLWEVMGGLGTDYNLTMGYPLTRTPVYALLDQILRTLERERQGRVRTSDYLALLLHPYVKNLEAGEGSTLRIFAHAAQELLLERGAPYLDVAAFERDPDLADRARKVAGGPEGAAALLARLREVHALFLARPRRSSTVGELSEALMEVLREVTARSPARYHPFFQEFFERAAQCLLALARLLSAREPFGQRALLHQLVRSAFEQARVPFNGLPVEGLQVMGVLETQTLNFDTVVLMDGNEEALPALSRTDPALPPPFRAALGLPGYAERMEVAKYHVFRLLEAARGAHVIYRETPEAQRSPFVEQLVFEAERAAGRSGVLAPSPLAFRSGAGPEGEIVAAKDAALLARLASMPYSASALDAYLQCPMKFYLGYAVGLREPEKVEEELDVLGVGRRLHAALAELFRPFEGGPLTPESYGLALAGLPAALEGAFPGTGEQALVRRLAAQRLAQLFEKEREALQPGARLEGVEVRLQGTRAFGGRTIALKGFADRIESAGGRWRIKDFKAGRGLDKKLPRSGFVEPEAGRLALHDHLRSFQLPLYAELLHQQEGAPYEAVQVSLVSLRSPTETPADLFGEDEDRAGLMESVFLPALDAVAAEILDPEVPFAPRPAKPHLCDNCPFFTLCRRAGGRGHATDSE